MEFWKWQQEQQKNSENNQKSQNRNQKDRPGQNTSPANNESNKYVRAPYNFVPFYNKVYPHNKFTSHNSVEENLITGEITYKITAETPIMIDDGTNHFFTDAKGRYAIPGSTMRGLIRNNVQVLGLCSYEDDIDDYALMYRNVANGAEKTRYNKIW